MQLFLFLVWMMGVGIGSAAAAWATRRPEMQVRIGSERVDLGSTPTPQQVAQFREFWDLAFPQRAKDQSTFDTVPAPTRPDPGRWTA